MLEKTLSQQFYNKEGYMPIVIIGAAAYWVMGGIMAGATTVAGYYGWAWFNDKRHEQGLVNAFKEAGPAGFRHYAYEKLGVRSKDELDAMYAVLGPKVAGKAAADRVHMETEANFGEVT